MTAYCPPIGRRHYAQSSITSLVSSRPSLDHRLIRVTPNKSIRWRLKLIRRFYLRPSTRLHAFPVAHRRRIRELRDRANRSRMPTNRPYLWLWNQCHKGRKPLRLFNTWRIISWASEGDNPRRYHSSDFSFSIKRHFNLFRPTGHKPNRTNFVQRYWIWNFGARN